MCLVTIKFSKLGSKNHWSRCVGGSPIDIVSASGLVQVPPDLINGLDFSIIELLSHSEIVWAAKAINYTVLVGCSYF
jgi:hypothetical protein